MSRTGEKKYYTVKRLLQFSDLVDHFQAGQARGAFCRYQSGQARALCFDADETETWDRLKDAARRLVHAEYVVILGKQKELSIR
jgi:hypothetical protein